MRLNYCGQCGVHWSTDNSVIYCTQCGWCCSKEPSGSLTEYPHSRQQVPHVNSLPPHNIRAEEVSCGRRNVNPYRVGMSEAVGRPHVVSFTGCATLGIPTQSPQAMPGRERKYHEATPEQSTFRHRSPSPTQPVGPSVIDRFTTQASVLHPVASEQKPACRRRPPSPPHPLGPAVTDRFVTQERPRLRNKLSSRPGRRQYFDFHGADAGFPHYALVAPWEAVDLRSPSRKKRFNTSPLAAR
ncbi:hypothetical protein DIPPA_62538 [Diplonema papillatum]|nr:hypothetical protein DIPPA_62538 [Diplonema papillatum]